MKTDRNEPSPMMTFTRADGVGLTKREHFVALAMNAMLSGKKLHGMGVSTN